MPRGHSNMYAEYVSVRRHILQVTATGKNDLFEKMQGHAEGELVDGFQVSDDTRPILFHKPFGTDDVGHSPDGPSWFAGSPFGEGTVWMRELARDLQAKADEIDAAKPTTRLRKHGYLVKKEACLRCSKTGCVEATITTDAEPGNQLLYKRCRNCGYRENLGWVGGFGPIVDKIRELNKPKAKA